METRIEESRDREIDELDQRAEHGELGKVALVEERSAVQQSAQQKISELRSVFAIADPENMTIRVGNIPFPRSQESLLIVVSGDSRSSS